ncbi:MAG TPA: RES family NAD+ phosphorylase [Pirellulales bacterium]|jgi:hypothetical protein|nr:RES family NAD+ phosphorylase [Pirellulales bacterium]
MIPAYANAQSALAFAHTSTRSSRFNEGGGSFSTLYLSEDQLVALFEVEAVLGSPHTTWVPVPSGNWTILSVSVVLQSIVDLTQAATQASLATTAQELTGDWRGYRLRNALTSVPQPAGVPAPTQELGAALYAVRGVEGFIAVSAKVPTRRNLVIFPDWLLPGSRLECRNDKGKVLYKIQGRRRKKGPA